MASARDGNAWDVTAGMQTSANCEARLRGTLGLPGPVRPSRFRVGRFACPPVRRRGTPAPGGSDKHPHSQAALVRLPQAAQRKPRCSDEV